MANVPTMEELGYPNFNHSGFVGLVGPAKLPQSIVSILLKALNDSIHSELFRTRMEALGMTIPASADNTPASYAAFLRKEMTRQGELATLTGHDPMTPKQ